MSYDEKQRTILPPIKLSENKYRIGIKHKLIKEIEQEGIVTRIKDRGAKCLGHSGRAGPSTGLLSMLEWKQGDDEASWFQEINNYLNRVRIYN